MEFNTAAESKTEIFEALRLDPGQAPIRFLEKKDMHRLKTSDNKIS